MSELFQRLQELGYVRLLTVPSSKTTKVQLNPLWVTPDTHPQYPQLGPDEAIGDIGDVSGAIRSTADLATDWPVHGGTPGPAGHAEAF